MESLTPRDIVSRVLQLPSALSDYWDIVDTWPKKWPEDAEQRWPDWPKDKPILVLVHYTDNFDPDDRSHDPLHQVRGVIVDLYKREVAARTYGYTQDMPSHGPIEESETHYYIHTDVCEGKDRVRVAPGTMTLPKSRTKLFLGYEGVMVRVFKRYGKVFFSTHRRIDATPSSWMGRRPFYDLYKELNGPELESLFDPAEDSPTHYHHFLVAHDELRLCSSTCDNRLIYLGVMGTGGSELAIPEDKEYPFSNAPVRPMVRQPSVDTKTANKFLYPSTYAAPLPKNSKYTMKPGEILVRYSRDGKGIEQVYYTKTMQKPDPRLAGGDTVIILTEDESGRQVVYRLVSPAFEYRASITQDDPNLYHAFVLGLVEFVKADAKEIRQTWPVYLDETGKPYRLHVPEDRRLYWWSIFYDAVAPAYKKEVDEYYKRYIKDVKSVAKFVLYEYDGIQDPELKRLITGKTASRIQDLKHVARDVAIRKRISPFQAMVELLYNETGQSIYKMATTAKAIDKLRKKTQA